MSSTDVVRAEIVVPVAPARAFELYVARPTRTHPNTGLSGDCVQVIYEPAAGGRWYETDSYGTEFDWGRVVEFDPPQRLVLAWMVNDHGHGWAFDPDPSRASRVEIHFSPVGGSTRVSVEHRGFSHHGPGASSIRRGASNGWRQDLADLAAATSTLPEHRL